MPRLSGGRRRDSRIANQRRLDLVRRLLRGPASAATLIADLRTALGDDIYPADARAALRHDMAALRETFGCAFFYRAGDGFFLTNLGTLRLLDLDDDELEALALIVSAVEEGALPQTQAVDKLRHHILALLSDANRTALPTIVPGLRVAIPDRTTGEVGALIARLQPMLGRVELVFHYRSPYTLADEVEQHRVAPYELFQRDGYTYLEAYCIESSLSKLKGRYISYRLDRIVPASLRRLPRQLAPVRYGRRSYRLRYELAPQVARRRDIALWFPASTYHYHEDGRAEVEAQITDLWQARTILMRYGEHCRVLEPPELIELIRDRVQRMVALYTPAAGEAVNPSLETRNETNDAG